MESIQKVICVSEVAILSHPENYNSTILLTWLVNTCVSICKKESTHGLKLQFLVFLNPLILSDFCILWYVIWLSSHIYTAWKVSKYGFLSGPYFPVFSSNAAKYGPEKTPHLDIFQALIEKNLFLCHVIVCHVLVNDAMQEGGLQKKMTSMT